MMMVGILIDMSMLFQKMFAEKLCRLVKGISESVPMKTLSFVSDACQLLVQCHKVHTVCVYTRAHAHTCGHTHTHILSQYI